MYKSIVKRFLKGAIAGAMTAVSMVALNTPTVWSDFSMIINSLSIAGTYGAITGVLLAIQKWASWEEFTE